MTFEEELHAAGAEQRPRLRDGGRSITAGDVLIWHGVSPAGGRWTKASDNFWWRMATQADVSYDENLLVFSPSSVPRGTVKP